MIIKKVRIENFKSISKIEIPFDKVGNSYTKIFVGINESGKSNILEALSYFEVPEKEASFDHFCNQKMEDSKSCDIYFSLDFEDEEYNDLHNTVNEIINADVDVDFSILGIEKNVYLSRNASTFEVSYDYEIKLSGVNLYIKSSKMSGKDVISVVDEQHKTDGYELLDNNNFDDYFYDVIAEYIEEHEPYVSVWKPSSEYLLYDANLNTFKEKLSSNKPLYNIFKLSGYEDNKTISEAIEKVTNPRSRSKLQSKLNDSLNDYIRKVWSNSIDLIIEITETGNFSLLIKDKGNENMHDRFSISERSQGAKQFLSLILSLSLETTNHERKNELILIDEPEVHLHPSGIRDLAKELLKIGQDNYVFLATHSPFMIDKVHKERHYIVKKNKKAITEITRIKDTDNIIDDEVLNEAFGINVYRDLLNPYSVLVEGASDKLILQKAFIILGHKNIGIANGHGSNIDTLASKMNYDNISILVITDDDKDGRKYKENILKIGGAYNDDTVYTIRDLVGDIVDQGTIEDTLGCKFVESQFIKYYKSSFDEELSGVALSEDKPLLTQIVSILKDKKKYNSWNMDSFKKQLSEEFNPTKTTFSSKFKLLKELAEIIATKLK
ncbi:MAG: AAA family ATPase [Paludibacteraceae bacterium]|nr:AAA family ATPase [Paludibacteraceae bacterium]